MKPANFSALPFNGGLVLLLLCFGGCASDPYLSDAGFGQSVRNAVAQQTLHPDAPKQQITQSVTDGAIVKSAIDRYQSSFETPPPPVNVMNIGLGGASGSTGR